MMEKIRKLKILLLTLILSSLAFGFYPLANFAKAITEGPSSQSENEPKTQCAEILKISKNNQTSLATLERLAGYLEASVTDIKMAVNGIDRKLNMAANQASKKNRI